MWGWWFMISRNRHSVACYLSWHFYFLAVKVSVTSNVECFQLTRNEALIHQELWARPIHCNWTQPVRCLTKMKSTKEAPGEGKENVEYTLHDIVVEKIFSYLCWKNQGTALQLQPILQIVQLVHMLSHSKQARKPRSYASPKLSLTDSPTGVKCRATSVAKNQNRKQWNVQVPSPKSILGFN